MSASDYIFVFNNIIIVNDIFTRIVQIFVFFLFMVCNLTFIEEFIDYKIEFFLAPSP